MNGLRTSQIYTAYIANVYRILVQTYFYHHEYPLYTEWTDIPNERYEPYKGNCCRIAHAVLLFLLHLQNGDDNHSAQQGKSAVNQGPPPRWHQASQTTLTVLCGYLLAKRRYLAPDAKWRRGTATFRSGSKLTQKLVDCLINLGMSRSVNSSYMTRTRGSSLQSSSINWSYIPTSTLLPIRGKTQTDLCWLLRLLFRIRINCWIWKNDCYVVGLHKLSCGVFLYPYSIVIRWSRSRVSHILKF